MDEFQLIRRIFAAAAETRADVALGIGDDAAVLKVPAGCELVATTDTLVEGVHFPKDTAPEDLGHRALAVNLSDLAGMGAEPAWALLALALPEANESWLAKFAQGFFALARRFNVALVGGNLARGPLNITLTLHGFVPTGSAVTRTGARVGDRVYVTGEPGAAAAGLRLWRKDNLRDSGHPLLNRFLRPEPRVKTGLALRGLVSAMIDVSDGLLADLGHILEAGGVGARLNPDAVPLAPVAVEELGREAARDLALTGGDDYELCFSVPAAKAARAEAAVSQSGCRATCIGEIEAELGLRGCDAQGRARPLPARGGYRHFEEP